MTERAPEPLHAQDRAPVKRSRSLTPKQMTSGAGIVVVVVFALLNLQSVTTHVSRYTGGALPENAGALVRRQLMSVPQRWRVARWSVRSAISASKLRR